MPTPNKKKKSVNCPCGAESVELTRDEDGDWTGKCGDCGRDLGRVATRVEMEADRSFFSTPPEPEKKKKLTEW